MAEHIVSPGIPAESCRAFAAQHFSVDRMVDRYLDVYDHAMSVSALDVA